MIDTYSAIGIIAFLLLFYAAALWILLRATWPVRFGRKVQRWPSVPAQLQQCVIDSRSVNNADIYYVSVKYTYTLGGMQYSGTNLMMGHGGSRSREAEELKRQRVLGMPTLMVRHDPRKPEISTIFPYENRMLYGIFVFGVLWMTFLLCYAISQVFAISSLEQEIAQALV